MPSLVLKLVLTPLLVGGASIAARRWGPSIGGWIVALPLYIYSKIRFGVTPEINAISTIIVAVTAVAVLIAWRTGSLRGREGQAGA